MEINRRSLAIIIRATRASIKLAKATHEIIRTEGIRTEADVIADGLKDALICLPGVVVVNGMEILDLCDRKKYIEGILNSDLDHLAAAEVIMNSFRQRECGPITPEKFEKVWQKAGKEICNMVCSIEAHRGDR